MCFSSFPHGFLLFIALGEIVSQERFTQLQSIVQDVKDITVGALVASERLQEELVRTGENHLLMHGFIAECKWIVQEAQRASSPQTQGVFFF